MRDQKRQVYIPGQIMSVISSLIFGIERLTMNMVVVKNRKVELRKDNVFFNQDD